MSAPEIVLLETARLLQPNAAVTNHSRTSSTGAGGSTGNRRPPLFSVPSSASLRSLKSLNDPDIDRLTDEIEFPEAKIDLFHYISYYLPILKWLPKYSVRKSFAGDFLSGLSIASFQIPLVMSFATSLGHLPAVTGLYSMIVGSLVYSILGSVPVLIVGPAPSLALLYGQLIGSLPHDEFRDKFSTIEIAATMTATASGILLGAGIFRFGFLSNVLSRSLLKGFLGAMGLIMIISQLTPELKLAGFIPKHASSIEQLVFVVTNWDKVHKLSFYISAVTLVMVMAVRFIKVKLITRYKNVIYFPELLLMVVFATFFCWKYEWHLHGVSIVGDLRSHGNKSDPVKHLFNPIQWTKISLFKRTFSTAFLCTTLGYFDSVIATKNLGARFNFNVSANRELIALGSVNLIACALGGLPAFGALGRSKINVMAGATSPMSGIVMAVLTIIAVMYLLPYLYYLPECVLALSTTIIGITVLEEVPTDLSFFWRIGGYDEIITFTLVFLITFFWSAEAGVTLGVGIAILRIIKKLSRSRIQILGRIPHSTIFRNADELIEESFSTFNPTSPSRSGSHDKLNSLISEIEEIEGVLIIKIPEPLNFANVGDLQNRLSRIEKYGSLLTHPSQPHTRDINNLQYIVFDCKGMSLIDSLATQILYEIVNRYIENDISVCFSRVPIDIRGVFSKLGLTKLVNEEFNRTENPFGNSAGMGDGFFKSIDEALKVVERNQHV